MPKFLSKTHFQSRNRHFKFDFHEKNGQKNAVFKSQCAVERLRDFFEISKLLQTAQNNIAVSILESDSKGF